MPFVVHTNFTVFTNYKYVVNNFLFHLLLFPAIRLFNLIESQTFLKSLINSKENGNHDIATQKHTGNFFSPPGFKALSLETLSQCATNELCCLFKTMKRKEIQKYF